jgi:hypothetical protein
MAASVGDTVMPTNVRIVQAGEFISATPSGVLDLAASQQLLADIAMAARRRTDAHVLLDTRKAMAVLDTGDLWTLAQNAATHAPPTSARTAVLCPAERFDHARFFAMCAERHSLNIRAFVDYEHAIEWLIGTDGRAT